MAQEVSIPYGSERRAFWLPEDNLSGVYGPRPVEACSDLKVEIRRALDHPLGTAPIQEIVQPGEKAVILVDDYTRATPAAAILPQLLERLNSSGIQDEDITLLVSTGSHRPSTEAELLQKVGPEIYGKYRLLQHDCTDQQNQVFMGLTSYGTPVWVNRLVVEADRVFGIGHIDPSDFAGYAGGVKLLVPGVAALETVDANHALAVLGFRQHGNIEVPCRKDIDEAGALVRADLFINAVLCQDGQVARLFAGTPQKVFQEGVALSRQVYEISCPEVVDIAISSAYPYDIDYYQAVRAVEYADHIVRPGGAILLAAPCQDGMGNDSFYKLLAESGKTPDVFLRNIARRNGKVVYNLLGYLLSRIQMEKRIYGFLPGISHPEMEAIGICPVETLQKGVDTLIEEYGQTARVAVFPAGSATIPRLQM